MNSSIIITGKNSLRIQIPVPVIFLVSLMVLAGGAENYGRLQRSEEIDKIFKGIGRGVRAKAKILMRTPGGIKILQKFADAAEPDG